MATINDDNNNGKLHLQQKKHATTDNNEPILDPELQEQLRKEIYGSGMVDDSSAIPGTNTSNKMNLATGGMMVMGASIFGLVGMQFPFLFIKHAPFMATPARKVQDALKFIIDHNIKKHNRVLLPSSSGSASTSTPKLSSSLSRLQGRHAASTNTDTAPPVFVDLGSGDGQAVYEAAKLGYKAVGIEFNWTLWAFSSFRRQFFWSSDAKRRSQILLQDFSNYNLKDADTVMVFAVPRTMPILGQKIQSECSPGTKIMAYRFEMPLANTSMGTTNEDANTATAKGKGQIAMESSADDSKNKEVVDVRLQAKCIYDQEEMRIYRMGNEIIIP